MKKLIAIISLTLISLKSYSQVISLTDLIKIREATSEESRKLSKAKGFVYVKAETIFEGAVVIDHVIIFGYGYKSDFNTATTWINKSTDDGAISFQSSNKTILTNIKSALGKPTGDEVYESDHYAIKYLYKNHNITIRHYESENRYTINIY